MPTNPTRPTPAPKPRPTPPPRPTHTIDPQEFEKALVSRLAIDIQKFKDAGQPVPQQIIDAFLAGVKEIMGQQAAPVKS